MDDQLLQDVPTGALAYAQSVLDWADAEGFGESTTALAAAAARFAAVEAYGFKLEWRWGDLRARVPALDPELAASLISPPSPRVRCEANLVEGLSLQRGLDLVGDSLTLRVAIEGRTPVALVGSGKALQLWREVLAGAAPGAALDFIDVNGPPKPPPFAADWVRCLTLSHWLEFAATWPPNWKRLSPIVTCDAKGITAPSGWEEILVAPGGGRVFERTEAVLRILTPPGRRLGS